MDQSNHKEFAPSNDGTFVAIGSVDNDVCVLRIDDGRRFDLPDVSYDSGGRRLAVDGATGTLFAGAYFDSGIAAYDIESGERRWHRRDLKKVQEVAYDVRDALLYCSFEGRASKPLNARDGRERHPIRGLKSFYFSRDGDIAVFEFKDVQVENRGTRITHSLPRESWGIVGAAFVGDVVALSWVGGPVAAYHSTTGEQLWKYPTEGTHAFDIALSSKGSALWVAEQPYQEPPWHRLRLISTGGEVLQEIRCGLGHSFKILPACDQVIRADLEIVAIGDLGE